MRHIFSLNVRVFALLLWVFFLSLRVAPVALAGGGSYSPVNFQSGDGVSGTSRDVVVKVFDWSIPSDQAKYKDEHGSPLSVGHEFRFYAHQDLPGASCTTTQSKSDESGQIKATCRADVTGRFVFHIESLTKSDIGNSPEYTFIFSESRSSSAAPSSAPKETQATVPPFVSTANGPCGSGFSSLEYRPENACKNGDKKVGYLKCANGFGAMLTRNECVSQASHTWTDLSLAICGHWACSAEHIASIDTPGTQIQVLRSATSASSVKPVVSLPAPQLLFLLAESVTAESQKPETKLYVKGTLNRSKKYQAYFIPISGSEVGLPGSMPNVSVLSAADDPWKVLRQRFDLQYEESTNSASLVVPPRLFRSGEDEALTEFLESQDIQPTGNDQAVIASWQKSPELVLLTIVPNVKELSTMSKSRPIWLPPLEISYGQRSIQDFPFPFAWQVDAGQGSGVIDYTLTFLTNDPFLAERSSTWQQVVHALQPQGLLMPNQTYFAGSYLSVLKARVKPNGNTVLMIERADPAKASDKVSTTLLAGDLAPSPTPVAAAQSEMGEEKVEEYQLPRELVWGIGAMLTAIALVCAGGFLWLRRRVR